MRPNSPENGIKSTLQNVKRSDEKIIVLFTRCCLCRRIRTTKAKNGFLFFASPSRDFESSILSHNNNIILDALDVIPVVVVLIVDDVSELHFLNPSFADE